jgi:hypothetical protein
MRTVFADASFYISFSIMERQELREAAATDHHFVQAGFVALLL